MRPTSLFIFVVFVAACSSMVRRVPAVAPELAIMQGVTSDTSTQIAILHRKDTNVSVVLRPQGAATVIAPVSTAPFSRAGSSWIVSHVRYEGLSPGITYELDVRDGDRQIDHRELQTLPISETAATWSAISCMDDAYVTEQANIWREAVSFQPRFLVFLGDNVYGDRDGTGFVKVATPDHLWKRYAETRNALQIFREKRLIPIFAVWDDHDYGMNDGDRSYPYRDDSLHTFNAFFPRAEVSGFYEHGPGAASHFEAFGQAFAMLDARTFRSPRGAHDDETHWGKDQEQWLLEVLSRKSVPTWLANGDQFFGAYHRFESYEGVHPKSFKSLFSRLRLAPGPLLFLSGDRHLAEVMEIEPAWLGYRTYELTSSAIHAKTFPDAWKSSPNRRQIAGVSGALNYMILSTHSRQGALEIDVASYGVGKSVHFQKTIRVESQLDKVTTRPARFLLSRRVHTLTRDYNIPQ